MVVGGERGGITTESNGSAHRMVNICNFWNKVQVQPPPVLPGKPELWVQAAIRLNIKQPTFH